MTEFNLQRYNPDSSSGPISTSDDRQLSINAFDKHQDMIRVAFSRVNDIMKTLKSTNAFKVLRSNLSLDKQDIDKLKILRIIKSEGNKYDAYITFFIDDYEYWGKIEDLNGSNTTMTSDVFKDGDLYQPKEWIIKTKGLIIKSIKTWLRPEPGDYKLLNNNVICYSSETGKQFNMEMGVVVNLIRSYDDKIVIKHGVDKYNLVGDNYIYFNYWFEKI